VIAATEGRPAYAPGDLLKLLGLSLSAVV